MSANETRRIKRNINQPEMAKERNGSYRRRNEEEEKRNRKAQLRKLASSALKAEKPSESGGKAVVIRK